MPEPTAEEKEQLAVTYAALILHDDGIAITADKLNTILRAAKVSVQPFWPNLFAKVLAERKLEDVILSAGSGGGFGGGAGAGAGAAAAAGGAPAAEEKKEEKKEEDDDEGESDEEMEFGLFD